MRELSGRQGATRRNLSGPMAYLSFNPAPLDRALPLAVDGDMARNLSACSRAVGTVEGMSRFLPNADMYLAMYVRKEALLSSQIEGTQCTLEDVLDPNLSVSLNAEVADVVNYVAASNYAVRRMESLPLCLRLLRETHEVLLAGVRGQDKEPGLIRTSQNWVGPSNSTIATAPYVPPNVENMTRALTSLETFINERHDIDPIAKAALIHYQFETIHPFLDGNGRLGRLLITLSLMNDGVLSRPILYPSYQLKLRRGEYYDWLTRVRETGDYEGWVTFFCSCLLDSAEDAIMSMERLVRLHNDSSTTITASMGRARQHGMDLLTLLEAHPILDIAFVAQSLGVSRTTAGTLVNRFCELGLLAKRDATKQRYQTFVYSSYLGILGRGGEPLN